MPVAVSEYIGVARSEFEATGAFNLVLDRDTLLFIDPALARSSRTLNVSKKITDRFRVVLTFLGQSKNENDFFWRQASKLFDFSERKGTCLGYSSVGTAGHGMGAKIQSNLLRTAKEIVLADIQDPEVLELVGLFEENVGCDLISDMITNIIWQDLVSYSERIF